MRLLKPLLLSIVLLPTLSFANTSLDLENENDLLAADRTFNNVPLLCYAGFRGVVDLLPEIGHQVNMKLGTKMIDMDSDTPNGYDTTFLITAKKYIPKPSVTQYQLHQIYTPGADSTTGTLYLNFVEAAPAQIDKIWELLDKGLAACAENLPEMPTIPDSPK